MNIQFRNWIFGVQITRSKGDLSVYFFVLTQKSNKKVKAVEKKLKFSSLRYNG